jgi:V/A-type H+-transporting ATPase subunit C
LSEKLEYAYAVSRIRAIERKMFDKSGFDAMIEAKSPEEAFKYLQDAEYGNFSGEIRSASDYEKLLKQESEKTFKLLREISPFPEVFDLFLLKNDFHNAKVILKGEFMDHINDEVLLDSGLTQPSVLKTMIRERKLVKLPVQMKKGIEEALDIFNKTGDPQTIDIVMDKALYQQMKDSAAIYDESFIAVLLGIMTDLANISTFFRLKNMKRSSDFLSKVLLPGGKIEFQIFIKNFNETADSFLNAVRYTPYGSLCEEGLAGYNSSGSFTLFEKLSDNYIISYIRKSRYVTFGVEPLVAYLIGKQYEIKNAGIIMVGKINKIPNDVIRERLRDTYA